MIAAAGEVADELVSTYRRLEEHDLVVGSVGNVSARTGEGMLITPTRRAARDLRADELTLVTAAALGEAPPEASREWRLHAAVYAARADVQAVVHTHSVHATAWSFLGAPLGPALEEIAYYEIGAIRTTPWVASGSSALADACVETLGDARAVLLGGHGVIACGGSLREAETVARVVERQSRVAWLLRGEARAARPTRRVQLRR